MAMLICKIGDTTSYLDGQVISALSDRRILQIHSEHRSHIKYAGFTSWGRRPIGTVSELYRSLTCQYRFVRCSSSEVLRCDIDTGEVRKFDHRPRIVDGKKQHIHVDEFVRRRLKHHRHATFGSPGQEVWYGGRHNFSEDRLWAFWGRLGEQPPTCLRAGRLDYRSHLVLPLMQSLNDYDADSLIKSKAVIDYRDLLPTRLIEALHHPYKSVVLRHRYPLRVVNTLSSRREIVWQQ